MKRRDGVELSGAVWLRKPGGVFLGSDRIELLEKIGEHGSILKAAKATGISYKTAWEFLHAINNLSEIPLVLRKTGGKGGGGTVLTKEGKEFIRKYRVLEREHHRFLRNIAGTIDDPDRFFRLLRRISMRVSARNVFVGIVKRVRKGAVNAEVTLALPGGDIVTSVITRESVDDLGLKKGGEVNAIIKASSVILGRDLHRSRISARNVLCGNVTRIVEGPVNTDVSVALGGGNTLTAVITEESLKRLNLKEGEHACAAIKASSILLGVAG
ncbi:MAG: TOBE domain-containing protein [Deltaproteobacteria bacterium]|nr:TOBE domain-containing protein [Deltaproteobacteria bacterium]